MGRRAVSRSTAAAADALRLATPPEDCGIESTSSQRSRTNGRRPCPSEPTTSIMGVLIFTLQQGFPPMSAP